MQFNSLSFIFVFLPVTLGGYLVLRKTRYANAFILGASIFFYASSALWYLLPLFVTALLDFVVGQYIADSKDERFRTRMLWLSVIANLTLLSIFKYTTWLTGDLSRWLAVYGITFAPITLVLPPAISFYTFQSMSYTIDIYRREFKPYRSVVDYLSFVSFFPHLVAGPIMRARDLLPQLARIRDLPSASTVSIAFFMILFGLFQKTVLADNFGLMVESIQRLIPKNALTPGLGLIFTYAFAFQIYCDFAAYTNIARGVARLFGVELIRNFLTPYFSSNPSEFWSRWHISLSSWLRDYLYIPLGGSRDGRLMTLRNLMITMLLGGLWHGAGVFFILWGLWHGLLLVFYRLAPIDNILVRHLGRFGKPLAIVIFFHLTCIGWIFFRATPDQFMPIVRSITELPGAAVASVIGGHEPYLGKSLADNLSGLPVILFGMAKGFVSANWMFSMYCWGLFLLALPLWVTDYLGWRRNGEFPDLFAVMSWPVRTVVILALLYGVIFFGRREANEFIYFAF